MIIKEYFYNIKCDCCHTLADEEMWHAEAQDAKEVARANDWRKLGGKHYCPNCWHYDDDDHIATNDGRLWDESTEELITRRDSYEN